MEVTTCARPGCRFHHTWKPFTRFYKHCCTPCAHGETLHSTNCTGAGRRVVGTGASESTPAPEVPPPWRREPEGSGDAASSSSRATPEASTAISLLSDQIPPTQEARPPELPYHGEFALPVVWARGPRTVLELLDAWSARYSEHLHFTAEVRREWKAFQDMLFQCRELDTVQRKVTLYAFADYKMQEALQAGCVCRRLNAHSHGLDARSRMYNKGDVTGVDPRVQCVLAMQLPTVTILSEAVQWIIMENASEFAFVCNHGTHRSVGCCLLLAIIAFPRARIRLTTRRTRTAAEQEGMVVIHDSA